MKKRSFVSKLTAVCASLVVTMTSVVASFSASAAQTPELPVLPVMKDEQIPAKFDFRDVNGKNYVTPVKFQNPFGTCWAFSAAAAAETTLLYANSAGVAAGTENNNIDLSEKFISWYAFAKLTDKDVKDGVIPASQVGEGYVDGDKVTDYKQIYDMGGKQTIALKLFANGMGPVDESANKLFRYSGKNGWAFPNYNATGEEYEAQKAYIRDQMLGPGYTQEQFEKDWKDEKKRQFMFDLLVAFGGIKEYAVYDDWGLADGTEYRFAGNTAVLKQFTTMADYKTKDEQTGELKYDEQKLKAVKQEIASGHALACRIYGDGGSDMTVFNPENWAQYISTVKDDYSANHGVAIVGYDDTYKKENFARDNDKDGESDPNSIPPADGAFIVKNSYGCITEEDEKNAVVDAEGNKSYDRVGAYEFGFENSGYFYLSYYDVSVSNFICVDFFKQGEEKSENIDQYDLLVTGDVFPATLKEESYCANVFTAPEDEYLNEIGILTPDTEVKVRYSIYKNPKNSDPTSGELLEKGEKQYASGGYFRFDLEKSHMLKKGDKYAVVVQFELTENGELYKTSFVPADIHNSTGIINKGESFVKLGGKWTDLSESVSEVKSNIYDIVAKEAGEENIKLMLPKGAENITIDNFAIKGFTTPAPTRFAGSDRFDTAAKISGESGLFESADTVVIASGLNFADALAGVPLAKAYNAPILLTSKDSLPAQTSAEIKRLGAKKAIILGGTGAVSDKVERSLQTLGLSTERLWGSTRFATANKIAQALEKKTGKAPTEVFFVIYDNFADALSASAAAAVKGSPILYVQKQGAVDSFTKDYLNKVKDSAKKGYVIGGTAVISEGMRSSLGIALGSQDIERVSGSDRYATCVEVNRRFADVLDGTSLCIAKGLDFPDALAGGVLAALKGSPLFLADKTLYPSQTSYLKESTVSSVYVFGGENAVPESLVKQIRDLLSE